jgi:ArsR family transcriptional regulator
MHDVIKAFKALSDETRLRILNLLLQRECCVCEVMQALNISQTRASRNLSVLHEAGFLKLRKEGLWSPYSVSDRKDEEWLKTLLAAVGQALQNQPEAQQDLDNLEQAVKLSQVCCKSAQTGASCNS